MCGIVGVSGIDHAAELTFLGLYALQHRGQEAVGICAVAEDGRATAQRSTGLVSEAFDEERLRRLPGRTALGHTRYSTAGGPGLNNAQPLVVRYHCGDLAVAHNGHITNAMLLRDGLVREGALFQSSLDTEVIVHLIARSRYPTPDEQIGEALSRLVGAFSLVLTVGETLYAARDPWGFRPLVLGRRGSGHIVASETCALDLIGAEYVRDLEPGEILKIEGDVVTPLRGLIPTPKPSPCIFELVYFARPDSHIFGASVDRARRAFGRRLAIEQPADADCVFSVPDSSNSSALGYSEASGIPLELGLIRNHYVGRTFIDPTQAGRDFRVRIKYNPVREVIEGKRVVVVDDSLVRGTTSRGLVSLIREAGAKEIHLRIASPPVRFPCHYGIDMPDREQLIGARYSVAEISEHLGVDSLGYLSLEGLEAAVKEAGPFCNACFSGSYPAPLIDLERGFSPGRTC